VTRTNAQQAQSADGVRPEPPKIKHPKKGCFFNFNIFKKIIIHIKKLLLFMIKYWEDIPVIKRRDSLCQK